MEPVCKIFYIKQTPAPEYVIVHDGPPSDSSAKNYYIKYKDYIKNVASSEIYATWPEATLYANILAIQSITLNRVYTEWSYCIQYFVFLIIFSKLILNCILISSLVIYILSTTMLIRTRFVSLSVL